VTLRAYKTKLVVNNHENNILRQCAGKARFVFNWGLAEWNRQYAAGEKPSAHNNIIRWKMSACYTYDEYSNDGIELTWRDELLETLLK